MEDYVHLHVHTDYSVLDGQSKVTRLVDKAVADGMKGMAVTDHGVMFGIKEFSDYCAKVNKGRKEKGEAPFKPVFGCEMYVARRTMHDKDKSMHDNSGYHLIVLAKNYHGYKNLIKLVSKAWVDGYYYKPRTDREQLEKYHEDLIVCSACIAGEIPNKIIHDDIEGAREACEWYHRVFGDDFYLELQRHEVKDPTLVANREAYPLQQKANKVLLRFAEEYGIKVICTNDCHFEDKETAEAHDHLLCLSTNEDLDDPKRMRYSKQEWFKTRQEMNEVFSDIPEALTNTLEILDKVEIYSIDLSSLSLRISERRRNGGRSFPRTTCTGSSRPTRTESIRFRLRRGRRSSGVWEATRKSTASSSKQIIWQSWLMTELGNCMATRCPTR